MRTSLSQWLLAMTATALLTQTAWASETDRPVHILASLPVTYGLSQLLLKGTPVVLERAAPANLPGSRQSAYFSGRGAEALAKLAATADAVVGVRSAWPDDSLYPMARRSNIRVVEVDALRPVDGSLPGVALQADSAGNGLNAQPWMSSNNLGRMADVIAADLSRLAPAAKAPIEANLAQLKQRLLQLTATAEKALAEADNVTVFSLSDHFNYLISGLNLDSLGHDARPDDQWSEQALATLQRTLADGGAQVVLAHRQPSEALAATIKASGARLVVLDSVDEDPVSELQGQVTQVIEALRG